jgi:hypothetical protein
MSNSVIPYRIFVDVPEGNKVGIPEGNKVGIPNGDKVGIPNGDKVGIPNGIPAYKACEDGIIELIIPLDALTNEIRITNYKETNKFDVNYAKFRASHAYVVSITNPITKESFQSSCSGYEKTVDGTKKKLVYTVGTTVYADSFDPCLDEVCGAGIHYFKSYDAAFNYYVENVSLDEIFTSYKGVVTIYDSNGVKYSTKRYENGKMLCQIDYELNGEASGGIFIR